MPGEQATLLYGSLQSELKSPDGPVRKSLIQVFATRSLLSSCSVSPESVTSMTLIVVVIF